MKLKLFAQIISFVFHPSLLPTFAFIYIIWSNPGLFAPLGSVATNKIVLIVAINTFLFPLITVFLMLKLGFIKSFFMEEKKERYLPYLATAIFYLWTLLYVWHQNDLQEISLNTFASKILTVIILGATISVFLLFLLNLFYKISMHTVGMGYFIGIALAMLPVSNYGLKIPFMIIILIAGLVGTARLSLGAHKPQEIYSGYLLGIICQLIAFIAMQ